MELKIKNRIVGLDHKPLVIAEIGINHGGNLEIAKKMVLAAKNCGCEIIKHQTHIVSDEMSKDAKKVIPGNSNKSIYDIMDECSLNEEEEYELMKFTEQQGLIFFSSPFSRAALNRLIKFEVPAIKIGSGECNNYPLLELVADYGKPTILSTGMNSIESIRKALDIFNRKSVPVALLHTTNIYPTPTKLVRLGALLELKSAFPENIVGLSDHTLNNNACFAAVGLGASILERHFTDTMYRVGPDIICSMDPIACKSLIQGSEEIWQMRGGQKKAIPEEEVTINFAFASVCSIKPIKKGETFTKDNIWVKRPGTGDIKAELYPTILGKKALCNIDEDVQLKSNNIKW